MCADIADNTKWFEADASNSQTPPNGFPENQLPSTVNDSARAVMGAIKRFYDHVNATVISGGTANAQTLTYAVAPADYVRGDRYTFIVGNNLVNTGPATLNINGLGAKDILISAYELAGQELRTGQIADVVYDGAQFQLNRSIVPMAAGFTPSNPTGTADATGVMMGLGGVCTVTPKVSGELSIWISGNANLSAVVGNPNLMQMRIHYGTGTAPTNGAALTGSTTGSIIAVSQATANTDIFSFSCIGRASGLALATAHWIDLRLSSASTNTAILTNLSMLITENSR